MKEHLIWVISAAVMLMVAGVPAALLLHRKLRQARTAAGLRIETAQGIVEEGFVEIGGIDQSISIRGEDKSNPVLLIIHGGPGSCYSIFTPRLRAWEKHFTVVQWDQRGAGKTFARTGRRGSGAISMKQLTSDGIEVAEYLRAHLGKVQLFLLASSMGSTFGMEIVRSRPDLFYAYIKGILSGLAAFFIAQVVCSWPSLVETNKAIGLAGLAAQSVENILSVLFWIVGGLLFWVFFAASRASMPWRVGFFWIPTVLVSSLGFAFVGMCTYLFFHFRPQ